MVRIENTTTLFERLDEIVGRSDNEELKKVLWAISKVNKLKHLLKSELLNGNLYKFFFNKLQTDFNVSNIKILSTKDNKTSVLYETSNSAEYEYLFKNIFDNSTISVFLECRELSKNEIMLLNTYFKEIIHLFSIETTLNDLKQSTTIDPLTQLQNRISFNNEMKSLVPLAIREKMKLGVLIINIDRFRAVNDEHGDEFGDRFLRLYADTIKKCIRKSDIAVRFGGGEFLVLLVHVKSIEMTMQIAEKIKNTLTNTYLLSPNNDKFQKTVSVGVSLFPDDSDDIHEVIKCSEMALLDVKDTGRNKLLRYEKSHRGSIELF